MTVSRNYSLGCDSLSLTSAPRIMIQVKLLYFITFLLSFNCLIIAFHNNRGLWKVGWSNPNWCINCSKVAISRVGCLERSFRTDGYYLGKIAAELHLMREAEILIFNMSYMKMHKRVPRPGHTKEMLCCWNAVQPLCAVGAERWSLVLVFFSI